MPIYAGVGEHPCILTFYNYDLYWLQNSNFSLDLFVYFLKDDHNYFLVHA